MDKTIGILCTMANHIENKGGKSHFQTLRIENENMKKVNFEFSFKDFYCKYFWEFGGKIPSRQQSLYRKNALYVSFCFICIYFSSSLSGKRKQNEES